MASVIFKCPMPSLFKMKPCLLKHSTWMILLVILTSASLAQGRLSSRKSRPASQVSSQPEMVLQLAKSADSLFFSPDGATLATFDDDEGLHLWDARTRGLRRAIYDPEIRRVPVFTPDGKSLISTWYNGDTQVRNIATGRVSRVFTGFGDVSTTGTNGVLLAGFKDGAVKIYSIRTGKLLRSLRETSGGFYFSPDGKRLAVADYDTNRANTIRVWDITSGKRLCETGGFKGDKKLSLSTVAGKRRDATPPVLFSPDGKSFVTGGIDPDWQIPQGTYGDAGYPVDYVAKVWDTRTGKLQRVLKGWTTFSRPYAPLAFSKDGKNLVAGGYKQVDIWHLASGKKIFGMPCSDAPVISADKTLVAFVTGNDLGHFVEVRSVQNGKLLRKFSIGRKASPLALSPDNRSLVVGADEPFSLTWWDWRTGRVLSSSRATERYRSVSSLVFSPDGTLLANHYEAPQAGKACVWDLQTGRLVSATQGEGAYARVRFGADGKTLSIFKYAGGEGFHRFGKSNDFELLSADGTRVAVATRNGNIGPDDQDEFLSLFDVSTQKLLWKQKSGRGTTINGLEFSPDGKTLATSQPNERGDSPANFSLWDTATGQVRHVLDDKSGSHIFAFSGDGRSVAAASLGGSIRMWDAWTGRLKSSLKEPTGYVAQLALSPDGSRLASTNYKGDLTLYDVKARRVLIGWQMLVSGSGQAPDWIAITPAGYYVASDGAEKYIRWRVANQLFPAQKYRSAFNRPDSVKRVLQRN